MEIFSQVSDSFPSESTSSPMDKQDSSSLSDDSTAPLRRISYSDEEVFLLATSRPKKRAGRRVFKETRHPIFRGVRQRNNNKWVCELREPNKKSRIWLGTYPTPEMAARAHDVAALALRGKSACLNYADSAWRLPLPVSNDAKDIRKAAAEAAEAFRPDQDQIEEEGSDHIVEVSHEEGCNIKTCAVHPCEDHNLDEAKTLHKNTYFGQINESFMDEEALFDMPGLLVNMAEGLLLSPPYLVFEDDDANWNRQEENNADVSLWTHSI